jgi:hypothetical protein
VQRVIHHEFQLQGEAYSGICLNGFDLGKDWYIQSWVDSAHNGTTIMVSNGKQGVHDEFIVLGSYPDYRSGPDWGWRTHITMPDEDHLQIAHFNIPPGESAGALAVRIDYKRD